MKNETDNRSIFSWISIGIGLAYFCVNIIFALQIYFELKNQLALQENLGEISPMAVAGGVKIGLIAFATVVLPMVLFTGIAFLRKERLRWLSLSTILLSPLLAASSYFFIVFLAYQ